MVELPQQKISGSPKPITEKLGYQIKLRIPEK
jgi:hypothetical protein